jgi:hypothetical protein
MQISPPLALLLLLIFVFTPSIQEWITQGDTNWYRPYQVWLGVIVAVFLIQRSSQQDEL